MTHKFVNLSPGSSSTPSTSNAFVMDHEHILLHQSSKSISLSAKLLNKVATKLAPTITHVVLSKLIEGHDGCKGGPKMLTSTSTSRLLNKMATNLTCIKQTLSKSIENGLLNDAHCSSGYASDDMGNGFYAENSLSSSTSNLSDSALQEMSVATTSLLSSCYNFDHLDMTLQNCWEGVSKKNDVVEQDFDMNYGNIVTPMSTINLLEGHDQYSRLETINFEEDNNVKEDWTNFFLDKFDEQLPAMSRDDSNMINYVGHDSSIDQDNNICHWTDDFDFKNCALSSYDSLDSLLSFGTDDDRVTTSILPYYNYENLE